MPKSRKIIQVIEFTPKDYGGAKRYRVCACGGNDDTWSLMPSSVTSVAEFDVPNLVATWEARLEWPVKKIIETIVETTTHEEVPYVV